MTYTQYEVLVPFDMDLEDNIEAEATINVFETLEDAKDFIDSFKSKEGMKLFKVVSTSEELDL